jgi:hypothetical protein
MGSKNHLKDKGDGKGIIQRFHLYIELDSPIDNVEYYKFLWCKIGDTFKWDLDVSCKTPTKYAFKHPSALAGKIGSPIPSNCYQATFKMHNEANSNRRVISNTEFKKDLFIKSHKDLIDGLSNNGNRHHNLCKICGIIKKLGFGKNEVLEVVLGNCNLPNKEITSTTNSLFK